MQPLQLNAIERQMSEDLEWALRAPEVQQHAGKLVAVYKKRVVGLGVEREAVVAQAAAKAACPGQDVVVVVVPPIELAEIRH